MLRSRLLHPGLVGALAEAGHGAKVLIADGNFPASTTAGPSARTVHLNLAPGVLTVTEVLEVLLTAVTFESAIMMVTEDGHKAPPQTDYEAVLGERVGIDGASRWDFYDLCRAQDVALIVVTGDERPYGNILLTIGLNGR